MKHHKYSESHVVYDAQGSVGRLVADAENADFVHLSLGENAEVEKHTQDMAVTFYVIDGCGTLFIDDTEIVVSKGDVVEVKADASRGWKNDGDAELNVLAVKHK